MPEPAPPPPADDPLDPLLRQAFRPAPAAARTPAAAVEQIAQYRLIREIGRGGQGVVHLAEDTRLRRRVAVKVLAAHPALSPEARARFEREARIASRLEHPGICGILDLGFHDGVPFVVLPYLEGETLSQKLQAARLAGESALRIGGAGPAGVPELLRLFEQAAEAVHAAHEAGVVHHDLKPGNIMVTVSGDPIVLDFGQARDVLGEESAPTEAGGLSGTPAYMSPEQLRPGSGEPDRRTDVWSLGVTLYECLTLRRPFEPVSRAALYREILAVDPPDPRGFNPRIPGDLAVVLARAMEKEPARRYATARELGEELRRVRAGEPIRAQPPTPLGRLVRWARRERGLATTLGAVVLCLAAALATSRTSLAATREAIGRVQRARDAEGEEKRRADAAAGEARRTLDEYERLADIRRLAELTSEQSRDLWPAFPEKIAGLESWLSRARELATRLPDHRATLAALRGRATTRSEGAPEPASGATWSFADDRDQWRHDLGARFIADLEAVLADDPKGETIRSVEERLSFARDVRRRTIEEPREAWDRAARAVARDSRFRGLALKPQVGLVPLGPDHGSALEEFWVVQSGERSERDARTGQLKLTERSGLVLVLLPGGSFHMGAQSESPDEPNFDPRTRSGEGPVRRETVAAFFLSKYEMTQGQWLHLTGENPSRYPAGYQPTGGVHHTLLHPVERVTWNQGHDVLRRLGLVLPTEPQWEYACRAGTKTPWWTGTDRETLRGAANLPDQSAVRWKARWRALRDWPEFDDGWPAHAPVGRFRPNAFGLHDMAGNLLEWCATPHAHVGNQERTRAIRGGSFATSYFMARSAAHSCHPPEFARWELGVRPARVLEE